MNNLFEYGTYAKVLLKVKTDTIIAGKQYAAEEPYLLLNEVPIEINYREFYSQTTAKNNITYSQFSAANYVRLSCDLSQKVCDLLFLEQDKSIEQTVKETLYAINNEIHLTNVPVDKVFVYEGNKKIEINREPDSNVLTGDFIDGIVYNVFYTQKIDNCYKLEVPHYPYFSLEATIVGNTNKKTNNIYYKFPAVSLITTPNLVFDNSGVNNVDLMFNIIDYKQEKPTMSLNNG